MSFLLPWNTNLLFNSLCLNYFIRTHIVLTFVIQVKTLFDKNRVWSFYFPVLSIDPVIGAIAAGNAVVLKPSEIAPASSSLLSKLLEEYLDNSSIRVVEGAVPETTALLEQKWDKIFYTGLYTYSPILLSSFSWYNSRGSECVQSLKSLSNVIWLLLNMSQFHSVLWSIFYC